MKKTLVLFLLLLFALPFVSNAQTFSLQELVVLTNKNLDDFDTYVVSRGFTYQHPISEDDVEGATYVFHQRNNSQIGEKFITLYTKYVSHDRKNITYQTLLSADYLKIKNQVKIQGFKFIKTEIYQNATFLIYKKGQVKLSLAMSQKEDDKGSLTTFYEIAVTRILT